LLNSVQSAIIVLPEGGKLTAYVAKVDALKKTLDIIGTLSGVIKSFNPGAPVGNTDSIVASIADVAVSVGRLFFGGAAFGTAKAPMVELLDNIKFIADNPGQFTLTSAQQHVGTMLKGTADTITSIEKSLQEFESAAKTISQVNLDVAVPIDVQKIFGSGKVAPFLTGMSEFAGELTKLNTDIKGNTITQAIKTTTDIVKSVNSLSEALDKGDAAKILVSTSLKKFADNAGLGNSQQYTITNKGVTMNVHLEVKMNAAELEEVIILRHDSIIKDAIANSPQLNPAENRKLLPYLNK
jgi:hypothetical protein